MKRQDVKSLCKRASPFNNFSFQETVFCFRVKISEDTVTPESKQFTNSYYCFSKTTGYCTGRKFRLSLSALGD